MIFCITINGGFKPYDKFLADTTDLKYFRNADNRTNYYLPQEGMKGLDIKNLFAEQRLEKCFVIMGILLLIFIESYGIYERIYIHKLESQKNVKLLIRILKENGPLNAARALGNIGEQAIEPLIDVLKDDKWVVRTSAIYELGLIKDIRAVEPLIAALKDKDWVVRTSVLQALSLIKDTRAVEPMIAALNNDEEWSVRNSAAWALKMTTGKNFGQDPAKWQKWWKQNKSTIRKDL